MRAFRALGWATLAAAPIMLVALSVAVSRPAAPPSLIGRSAWAALLAGALGFASATLAQRGLTRGARLVGGLAVLVVASFSAFLAWLASAIPPPT